MKIEISAPQVQISPLMTPRSAYTSTFPISLAQMWLQDTEIWSQCVILGLLLRDFGNCSLINSTSLCQIRGEYELLRNWKAEFGGNLHSHFIPRLCIGTLNNSVFM